MSRFSARITIEAPGRAQAIFDSLGADVSGNRIQLEGDTVRIDMDAGRLPHLRANLNSTLRLVQACDETLESVGAHTR